jgi:hypothetical protein
MTPQDKPESEKVKTIIKIEYPFSKILRHKWQVGLPLRWKLSWLFQWGGGSIHEFGGKRINTTRHLSIFCRHILTINRNEYHDRSDAERAEEYLKKWAECEKELRGLRLIVLGDETGSEVKRVIRDSLGVDLDEGTIR